MHDDFASTGQTRFWSSRGRSGGKHSLHDDNAPDITTLQGPMYFPGHLEIGEEGNFLRVLIGTGFQFMRVQERTRKGIQANENYR